MKKFMQRRILPLLLAFSLTVGVVSVASVEVQAVDPVLGAVGAAALAFLGAYGALKQAGNFLKDLQRVTHEIAGVPLPGGEGELYGKGEGFYSDPSKRLEVTEDWLLELQLRFVMDGTFNDDDVYTLIREVSTPEGLYKVIQVAHRFNVEDANGVPINEKHQAFVMYQGYYLCVPVREFDDDDAHEKGIWMKYDARHIQDISSMQFLNLAKEYQRLQGIDCSIVQMDEGYVLTYMSGSPPYATRMVYCSPDGRMYVAPSENRTITSGRDETDEDGNENGFDIDPEDMTMVGPDGEPLEIDGIYYNPNTHTYYIDARDQSTNIVYNFSVTYNIQYTNVTYIGQTAEFNKYYEFPYNLPDGRGSADLTAEELEQLNVSIDVVPYVRYSDDTSVRALYHFDGDTRDSSYWNYQSEFDWKMGSSITYMDAGVFKGALYMDETVNHAFSISLPSNLGSKDFTIQWRYYQSYTATAASAPDGYVNIDGIDVFSWNGKKFYSGLGASELGATSTGQWLELALIRSSGTLYFYVNGLPIGSVADSNPYGDKLTFGFGALQKTYKYFDELRVLNFAYVEDGADYTPTSVPHDTNLALVLPNSMEPIADEYWSFNTEGNLLTPYDFTALDSYSFIEDIGAVTEYNNNSNWQTGYHSARNQKITLYADDGYTRFTGSSATGTANGVLFIPLYTASTSKINTQHITGHEFVYGNEYVFSVMLAGGSLYSVPFVAYDKTEDSAGTLDRMTELPDGSSIAFEGASYGNSTYKLFGIKLTIPDGQSLDIVYMELKQGTEPNTGHEFVTEVVGVDKDALKTPTLAVKTDLYISGYQIGGVRPSVPEKGLVWALVEGGFIKSLQIYTGSAWEAVDGRIWTGSRWTSLSMYDVLLLKDMYDITGIVSPDDYEYIYTESGFWSWWQKSWLDFVTWIQGKDDGSVGGSGQDPGDALPDEEDPDGGDGWKFVELLLVIRDGLWDIGTGLVWTIFDGLDGLSVTVVGIGDYFDCFKPGGCVFGIYNEGVDVWD